MKANLLAPIAAAIAFTLLSRPDTLAADPVEMKLKWEVGKQYQFRNTMKQLQDITVPGMPQPIRQVMDYVQDFTISPIKQRPDGGHELEMQFTGLKMDMKMNDVSHITFDSKARDNPSNATVDALKKVVGSKIQYVTDPKGNVIEVKGAKELAKSLDSSDPQAQALVQGLFNEDNLKHMYALDKTVPPKPINIGETWPVKIELNAGPIGTMVLSMNNTFKGWDQHGGKKAAVLAYTGTMSTKPGAAASSPMGEVSIQNAKITGTNWFDPALGLVVDGAGKHDMTMKMSPGGQELTSKISQEVTTKLLETKPLKK